MKIPVKDFESLYYFDNQFNICREQTIVISKDNKVYHRKEQVMPLYNRSGYYIVCLSKNGIAKNYFVHRLIALTFIPIIEGKNYVNHIDGNKLNNSIENLEWCTHSENMVHAVKKLKVGPQKKVYRYSMNGEFLDEWNTLEEAGKTFNIHPTNIGACCRGLRNYAGEFQWKFHKYISISTKNIVNNISKPINQYSLDENFIKSFISMAEACIEINLPKNMFSYFLNKYPNKLIKYGNFKWKFK